MKSDLQLIEPRPLPCTTVDPDTFFPKQEEYRGQPSAEARIAIAICNTCNIIDKCLEDALERGEKKGIQGGMTGRQREALSATMGTAQTA